MFISQTLGETLISLLDDSFVFLLCKAFIRLLQILIFVTFFTTPDGILSLLYKSALTLFPYSSV